MAKVSFPQNLRLCRPKFAKKLLRNESKLIFLFIENEGVVDKNWFPK